MTNSTAIKGFTFSFCVHHLLSTSKRSSSSRHAIRACGKDCRLDVGLNSDAARGKTGVTYKHSKKKHNEFNSKRPAGHPGEEKKSSFTGFSNQKKIHSAIHPSPSHHISGCWQSGMMARGPWINPQPDVYASPVCLIGSPPLRTTLAPPHPRATTLSLLMGTR